VPRPGIVRLRVPDLPLALINAGRAFVTTDAVTLFWIVTGWPPLAGAIIWAAVKLILLSLRADQSYAFAVRFAASHAMAAVSAAILAFGAILRMQTFAGFSIALGVYLLHLARWAATGTPTPDPDGGQ